MSQEEIDLEKTKEEICTILEELHCKYEIYTANNNIEEYRYLNGKDLCITVSNPTSSDPLYIDLEENGECMLSYSMWHDHYFQTGGSYPIFMEDLKGLLESNKCILTIKSNKRWLSSRISEGKIDKNYEYQKEIQRLPKEFQEELREVKGTMEYLYWDAVERVVIDL